MATTMGSNATGDKAHESPAWLNLEELGVNVKKVRQAVEEGRHATEEFVARANKQVQQHPLRTLAIATTACATLGCLAGFALGSRTSAARPDKDWIRIL